MEEEIDKIWIQEDEAGERLDKVLARRFKDIQSRTYFQMLLEQHLILLNGNPVKKRTKTSVGDEVEIQFALTPEVNLLPEPIPLEVLYEDEHLLIINKPTGMVVHPAPGNWSGTFVNALLYHCLQIPVEKGSLRPGIVHRLDKNTSGALIAAKTPEAHQRLSNQFAERKVYKEYLTICIGNPGDAEINAALHRHPIYRQQMAIASEGGKPALTYCKTLCHDGKLSIVKVVIATGRTHQIRVHLQHLKTPILGDPLYGNKQWNKRYELDHQMLHAHILRFPHPIHGQEIEVRAPIPNNMHQILCKISSDFSR